jgi:hypothetical protein
MSAPYPGYLVQTREYGAEWVTRLEGVDKQRAWAYALDRQLGRGESLRMFDRWGVLVYQKAIGIGRSQPSTD